MPFPGLGEPGTAWDLGEPVRAWQLAVPGCLGAWCLGPGTWECPPGSGVWRVGAWCDVATRSASRAARLPGVCACVGFGVWFVYAYLFDSHCILHAILRQRANAPTKSQQLTAHPKNHKILRLLSFFATALWGLTDGSPAASRRHPTVCVPYTVSRPRSGAALHGTVALTAHGQVRHHASCLVTRYLAARGR